MGIGTAARDALRLLILSLVACLDPILGRDLASEIFPASFLCCHPLEIFLLRLATYLEAFPSLSRKALVKSLNQLAP